MQLSLTAKLFLAEVSGSARKTIVGLYQNQPSFPKDPAHVDSILKDLDACLPKGLPANKQKVYLCYLAKQVWGISPPTLVFHNTPNELPYFEDPAKATSALAAFETALKEKRLTGTAADINNQAYNDIGDLIVAAGVEKEQKTRVEFSLDNLPEQAELANQPGNPRKAVAEGSKVIASDGAWKCYKINQGDPKGKEAGSWLAANKWWGVEWCVGRDRNDWKGRGYMDEGNFYVLARDGVSRYAIATDRSDAEIYNPADAIVWRTGSAEAGSFPSLTATAKKLGSTLDLSSVSSLPPDAIGILRAAVPADPYLAERIPETQLGEVDTAALDKVIVSTDATALVKDLNTNATTRGKGMVDGIIARCVARKVMKDFSGVWEQFGESVMGAYIEALSATGYKSLPPSLEEYFMKEAENFEF